MTKVHAVAFVLAQVGRGRPTPLERQQDHHGDEDEAAHW